jgi:hypothetical protein
LTHIAAGASKLFDLFKSEDLHIKFAHPGVGYFDHQIQSVYHFAKVILQAAHPQIDGRGGILPFVTLMHQKSLDLIGGAFLGQALIMEH